jgi:predicted nucleic acid-binding protein
MSSTTAKVYFDTNVLVYSADKNDTVKQLLARSVLREAVKSGLGVLSTQVLQEFYVVATKKLGIDPLLAKELITHFENMEVVHITPTLIREAIDTSIVNQLSFWDALIVVAAESAACRALLTEDLNSGQTIRGVRVNNPFLES